MSDRGVLSPESVDFLNGEFLRLHKMVIDGRDAHTKLEAVAAMLKAEGLAFPETDPPVVMAVK